MTAFPQSAPTCFGPYPRPAQSTTSHPSPFNYTYMSSSQFAPVGGYFPSQREIDPFYASPLPPVHAGRGQSSKTKSAGGKRQEGKTPSFLTKLYQILDTPAYSHMIRWDDTGSSIIIAQPELLARTVLPLVYRQSRFASFSRQLNIYGFMRRVSSRVSSRGERSNTETELSFWTHPDLRRGSTREEVMAFKRRVQPRINTSRGRRSHGSFDSTTSPTSMSDEVPSPEPFGKLLGDDEEPHQVPVAQASSSLQTPMFPWDPSRRSSAMAPPSAYVQPVYGFEPHSAPASAPSSFASAPSAGYRPRESSFHPSHLMASPFSFAAYPRSASNPTQTFNAPTFSLNDASTWYSCGVAELAPPSAPAQPPVTPDALPTDFISQLSPTEPFDGNHEVFAMSPDGFQTHPSLAPSDNSPRVVPQPRGFAQNASLRRREKPLPIYHPTWPKQLASPTLLFSHDPHVQSPLRRNSGATFMGADLEDMEMGDAEQGDFAKFNMSSGPQSESGMRIV